MRKLDDSLMILNKLSLDVGFRMVSILKADSLNTNSVDSYGKDSVILNSLLTMNIIEICSYLDEYHEFLGIKTEKNMRKRFWKLSGYASLLSSRSIID